MSESEEILTEHGLQPDQWREKRMLKNVLLLGTAFLLMYTAFQTMNGVLQTVLDSYNYHHPGGQEVNGLVSLGIFYGVCAITNWLAPSIMTLTGLKPAVIIGGFVNTIYIGLLIFAPKAVPIYIFSVIIGIGGSLIWVGQGTILIVNSTAATIGRNTGIFYFMFEASLVVGNTFIYYVFNGQKYITDETRLITFSVLAVVSLVGTLVIFTIRELPQQQELPEDESLADGESRAISNQTEEQCPESKWTKAKNEFNSTLVHSWHMMKRGDIIMQSVMWAYNGLEITFWSGVFPTCIGQTKQLANRFGVVGLSGIIVGVGELSGAALSTLTGNTTRPPRGPLVCLGLVCHAIAFFLCFLVMPDDSPTNQLGTDELSWLVPSKANVLSISFLLGFGDGIFQNQICSLIGLLYPSERDAAASFSLFQFMQCLFAAAAFFYSSYASMTIQLAILATMLVIGVAAFLTVEVRTVHKRQD